MTKADYAFIKGTDVVNIAVFDTPNDEIFAEFKKELQLDNIVQASANTTIGGTYDGTNFWRPQPFPSWVKDEATITWVAPTPMPTDGKEYTWDEPTKSWIAAPAAPTTPES
jgi:hypothetical protein